MSLDIVPSKLMDPRFLKNLPPLVRTSLIAQSLRNRFPCPDWSHSDVNSLSVSTKGTKTTHDSIVMYFNKVYITHNLYLQ